MVNIARNVSIMLNNLRQMRLKQFKKSNYKTGEKDEANGDLTGNKVANKITKNSQQSNAETVTN